MGWKDDDLVVLSAEILLRSYAGPFFMPLIVQQTEFRFCTFAVLFFYNDYSRQHRVDV
jgi:hypothetical protein